MASTDTPDNGHEAITALLNAQSSTQSWSQRRSADCLSFISVMTRNNRSHYERGRRPSEFSLNMIIFYTWATQRTRPIRPTHFSASYIFWTMTQIFMWFPPPECHIQLIISISILTLSIRRQERDKREKRPMLASKTHSEPEKLTFHRKKSVQAARFSSPV